MIAGYAANQICFIMIASAAAETCVDKENTAVFQVDEIALAVARIGFAWRKFQHNFRLSSC